MKAVWQARTGSGASPLLQAIGDSTVEDAHFLAYDIQGSVAHVIGLAKANLITPAEADALVMSLQSVPTNFVLDPALEDVHMNLEAYLTAALGETGKKVHTGRSRNDQVATCIALYARDHLCQLGAAVAELMDALHSAMEAQGTKAWVAKTHGKPAQPATVAFLLHAHAARFLGWLGAINHTTSTITSPLGSGAIGGSTLPLDPEFTANLLALPAAPNALLATGTRDVVVDCTQLMAKGGLLLADLAQDLLGAVQLDSMHTTGSSLMPHKRNPDALELLRGKGATLAQTRGFTAGLGLGYQRDLQWTKPALLQLPELTQCIALATEILLTATFDDASLDDPGLLATDLAEALVQTGMPFREAYTHVAQVYAAVESGTPFTVAVQALGLPATPLVANPDARTTYGAPANLPSLQPALEAAKVAVAQAAAAVDTAAKLAVSP